MAPPSHTHDEGVQSLASHSLALSLVLLCLIKLKPNRAPWWPAQFVATVAFQFSTQNHSFMKERKLRIITTFGVPCRPADRPACQWRAGRVARSRRYSRPCGRGAVDSRCTLRLQGRNELSLQKGVDALEMCGKRQSIVPHCSCMSIGEFYGFRKSFKTIYTALRIANSGVARQDGG